MDFLRFLRVAGSSSEFLGVPRGSSEFLGVPQSSPGFLRVCLGCSEFLRVPWSSFGQEFLKSSVGGLRVPLSPVANSLDLWLLPFFDKFISFRFTENQVECPVRLSEDVHAFYQCCYHGIFLLFEEHVCLNSLGI